MDSWWQLGDFEGHFGTELAIHKIMCPFCMERGNFETSHHEAKPCEADIASDVERFFQQASLGSKDRVALFRRAHDVAVFGFGNRQMRCERFAFGLQNVMASIHSNLYDKDELKDRVNGLLLWT